MGNDEDKVIGISDSDRDAGNFVRSKLGKIEMCLFSRRGMFNICSTRRASMSELLRQISVDDLVFAFLLCTDLRHGPRKLADMKSTDF